MWSRLSNIAQNVQGMMNTSLREDVEAGSDMEGSMTNQPFGTMQLNDSMYQETGPGPASMVYGSPASGMGTVVPDNSVGMPPSMSSSYPMAYEDYQAYIDQQNQQLTMLKDLLRERDSALLLKDKQLQELNVRYSRLKLQSKSQAASLNKELEEARRVASDVLERSSVASDESVVTISSEVSAPSASDPNASTFRAKLQVARKRLEEMERKVHELESRLAKETQELQYVSAERDRSVDALTKQVKELTARLEYSRPQGASTDTGLEARMEAMLTQMMVKDQRLLELTASITEHEQTIMDLREHVSEKQQVVDTRSKVVQLLQETLTDRDETIREQEGLIARLVAANDRFKSGAGEDQKVEEMQRYFEAIDRSRTEATALKEQLIERDYRLQAQDKHIAGLVQQAQQLQQQLQQQQQQLSAASSSTKDAVADVAPGSGKEAEGSSGSLKAAEAKFVKFKAQAAAKIKALEGEVARLKQASGDTSALVTLRDEIIQLEQLKGHLENEVRELQKGPATMQQQPATASSDEINNLQLQLTNAASEIATLQQQLQQLAGEHDAATKSVAELNQEKVTLLQQLQQVTEEHDAATKSVADLNQEKVTLLQQLQQVTEEHDAATKSVAEVNQEKVALLQQIDQLGHELSEKANLLNEATKAALVYQQQLEAIQNDLLHVSGENDQLSAQLTQWQEARLAEQQENSRMVAALQDQCSLLTARLEEQELGLAEKTAEATKLFHERERLENAMAQNSGAHEQFTELLENKNAEIANVQHELSVVKSKMRDAEAELIELKDRHSQLSAEHDSKAQLISEAEKRQTELEADVAEQRQLALNAQQYVANVETERNNLRGQLERVEQELAELKRDNVLLNERCNSERDGLLQEISSLKNQTNIAASDALQLQQTNERLEQLQSENKELHDQIMTERSDNERVNKSLTQELTNLRKILGDLQQEQEELASRISELEKLVAEKDELIVNLKLEIASKENALAEVNVVVSNLQSAVTQKSTQLDNLEKQLQQVQSDFEHEKAELLDTTSLLKSELAAAKAECEDKKEKLLQLAASQQEVEEVLAKKSEALDEADKELERLRDQLTSSRNAVKEKDTFIAQLEQVLEEQRLQVSENEKAQRELERRIHELDASLASSNDHIRVLESSAEEKGSVAEEMNALLRKNKEQLAEKVQENGKLLEQVELLTLKCETLATCFEQQQVETRNGKEQIDNLQALLSNTSTDIDALNLKLQNALHECENAAGKIEVLNCEKQDLLQQADNLRSELTEKSDQLASSIEAAKLHKHQLGLLQNEHQQVIEERGQLNDQLTKLHEEIQRQRDYSSKELADLHEQCKKLSDAAENQELVLAEKTADITKLMQEKERLENAMAQSTGAHEQFTELLENKNAELTHFQHELSALKSTLKNTEAELAELKSQHSQMSVDSDAKAQLLNEFEKRQAELEADVNHKQQQLSNLQQHYADIEAERTGLKNQLDQEVAELKLENRHLHDRCQQLTDDLMTVTAELHSETNNKALLLSQFEELDSKSKSMVSELENEKTVNDGLTTERDSLLQEIARLKVQVDVLALDSVQSQQTADTLDKLSSENRELQNQLQMERLDNEKVVNSQTQDLARLRQELDDVQQGQELLASKVRELEEVIRERDEMISHLKSEVALKENALAEASVIVGDLQSAVADKSQHIYHIEQQLEQEQSNFQHEKAALENTIKSLTSELGVAKADCESTKEKLLQLAASQQEVEEVLAKKSEALDEAEKEMDSLKQQLNVVNSTLADKENVITRLQHSLEEESGHLSDSEKVQHELERRIHELDASLTSANDHIRVLESSAEEKGSVAEEMNALLRKNKEQLAEKVQENGKLLEQVELLTLKCETLATCFEQQQVETSNSKDVVDKLQTLLSNGSFEIDSLNMKLESMAQERDQAISNVEALNHEKTVLLQQVENLRSEVSERVELLDNAAKESLAYQNQLEALQNDLQHVTEASQQRYKELEKRSEELGLQFEDNCRIITALQEQCRGLASQLQEKERVLAEKSAEIAKLSSERDELKSSMAQNTGSHKQFMEILDKKNMENANMHNELSALKSTLRDRDAELSEWQNQRVELLADIESKTQLLDNVQSNFEHEKEELHGKLRLLALEVDNLKAECSSKQEKLLMLAKNQQEEEEVLIKKSEALEAAEVELDAIKLQLSNLKNAAAEKDILMVSLQQSIEDQNARLTDSEKLVGEKEAELEALQKSFEEKEVQLKKCTALIKKLKMQVKEINEAKETELEQLRAQEEALRNKYDEVVAEKSDLDRTLTELQEKLSTSRDSYALQNDSRADDSMEDVVEEKIEAQRAAESLVASPGKVHSEVEQLQALADELVKSNSELKRANDGLVQYEQTVADLEQQIQALQKELDNRQADMESMHTGLVQYEQTVVDLEQQIQVLQQELENKQTDFENMQAHLKNEESQLERASHEAAEAAENMKKIETLQVSVHELKMENDRLVAELTAARQISALSKPSSAESSPIAASTPSSKPSSNSELSAEKLAMKLDVSEAKNAKMLAKLRQFKEKNDELQKKIAELESKSSLDESNSNKLFVDVGSVTDSSIQEKSNASVCTEPADENNELMLIQQHQLADVESKLSESESHCKELELKAAFLANELDNANQQIVALQTELALSSEVEQSHLADLQNKLLESDDLNSELASKAASLSSELDDAKKHVAALQAELAACNERSTNMQHDRLADLEIEMKKSEDQRTELELKTAELDESKNIITALQAELAANSSASAHLQELVLENRSQAETIAELSEALQQSEEALKVAVEAGKEKEKEQNGSWDWGDDDGDNNSVQHLKTALEEKDKQLNALNAKLSDFEEQWQNDCEKHQDTLNKLQLAEERLADNEQELAKYLATIRELEMRLKQMRGSSPQMNRGSPSPQLAQLDAGNLATENRMLHHQLEELREKYATLEAEYEGTTEEMQLEVARLQQTVQQYEQRQHMLPVREISSIHEEVRRQVQPLQTSAPDKSSPLKSSPNTVASTLTELSGEQLEKLFVENAALKELNQSASDQLKLKSKAAEDARKEVESRLKDIERLEAELTRCRQEAEEERKSFDRQQSLVAKEAHAFQSRCTSLEEQLSEVDNLQDQIVETSALNAHLQRKLDALQADKQEIEDQLTVAQKKVQQLKQDLEDSTDYNEQMQAQLVELSSEKSILIRQLEGLKLEASELRTVQQAHELSLKKHDELKAECKSLQHKLFAAESRLQELEHCEAECVSLNAEVTRVLGDNTALVLKVGELYDQVKALEATVEQQRVDSHKQLAAELDAAKSEQEQLKLDKQRLGETLKEAIDSATTLSEELKELRAEKLKLDSVNRELDAKLVEATNAAAQSVDELALLTDELQTVTSDRAQQEQIIAELKAQQMALLATVAEQNAQLAELKEENARNEHKWEMAVRDVKLMHVETNRLRMLEEEHERDKRFIAEKLQRESGEHLADKETLAVELEEATQALQLRDDKLRLANNKLLEYETRQREDGELLVKAEEARRSLVEQIASIRQAAEGQVAAMRHALADKDREMADMSRMQRAREQRLAAVERELNALKTRIEAEKATSRPVTVHKPLSPTTGMQENIHLIKRLQDVEQSHKVALNQVQQLEQLLTSEREQRSRVDEALAHTQQLLSLREHRDARDSSSYDLESVVADETRPLQRVDTTLVRQWQSYVSRLRRYVTHSSVISHRRPRIRMQAVIGLYLVVLHAYVLFGCLLELI